MSPPRRTSAPHWPPRSTIPHQPQPPKGTWPARRSTCSPQDPAFAGPIDVMARQPPAASQRYFEPVSTIALTAAALLVLQTRVKFKRDHTRSEEHTSELQ